MAIPVKERDQRTGGDDVDGGLHSGAPDEPDTLQEAAAIVRGGLSLYHEEPPSLP